MKNSTKLLYGLGFATVLGVTTAFATVSSLDRTADTPEANDGVWRLEATAARIIGGYGNNFAYSKGFCLRFRRLFRRFRRLSPSFGTQSGHSGRLVRTVRNRGVCH